ncbi:MAG: hypothetical protein IPF79_04765 [Ignavibacteria bacterium]|nr:hypothetical protein [Ignavibacteria bacterium]
MDINKMESLYGECPICKSVVSITVAPETMRDWYIRRGADPDEFEIERSIAEFRRGLTERCLTEGRGNRDEVMQRWGNKCGHSIADRRAHIDGQVFLFGETP